MTLLAQISDLHFDGGERAAARAHRVLTFLEGLPSPVDAVLVTGDITDHGTPAEYEEARSFLDRLRRRHPVLTCPGNHDVRGPYRKVLLGQSAGDEPINEVDDLAGVRVAMCDSSIPGRHDGLIGDDTLTWLTEVLDAAPADVPVLVAFHHPPVVLHSPFIDAIRQRATERLEALLVAHRQVVAVLCGHAHTAAVTTFAGRPLLVAPGVASTLRLPWETDVDLDLNMPPAIGFHVLDENRRITTHYRLVPGLDP